MEEALKELTKIIELDGVDRKSTKNAQKIALAAWIDSYITEIVVENSMIKSNLNSDEEDFLKYYLGYQIAEKLIDDCATVINESNKVKVKVLALGKKFPKNKE